MIFANATFATGLLVVLGVGYLCWAVYMMTCKPKTFVKLMQADQDIKDRKAERAGKVTKGVLGIAARFLKK